MPGSVLKVPGNGGEIEAFSQLLLRCTIKINATLNIKYLVEIHGNVKRGGMNISDV